MNIQFESIKLTNFLSLGSVQVDLRERGFVLVEGVNKCSLDNAKSNGAGKSSIFEGIVWVLTGDTSRGVKDVVNKAVGKSTCGELDFTIDGNKYKIIRYRDDLTYGNSLKVYFNGEDVSGKGVRDSSKILEQYLPDLNAQLLGSVIVLGQGLPQRFTNNTPSGRKEILEQLSKSDFMIEDIKNKLSLRRVDVNTELRNIKDNIISKQSSVSTNRSIIERKKIDIDNLPSADIYISKIAEAENRQNQVNKDIDSINIQVNQLTLANNEFEGKINGLQTDINNEQEAKKAPIRTKISQLKEQLSVLSYKESDLGKQIRDADNVQTICPYCKRPFDDVHKIDTTEWQLELDKCKQEQSLLRADIDKLNEDMSLIDEQYASKRAELNNLISQRNDNSSSINELTRKLFSLQSDAHSIQLSIVKYKDELQSLDNRRNLLLNEISTYESEIDKALSDITELTKQQGESEDRVEALNKLVNIASKDFRTYLLENVIDYIDTRFKYYASKLFNSTQADFRSEGNQIWIGYCGKQYEALSGGEKQKADLSIQFAIRDMLMKILRFSCNILVLDEVFDNLDELGCNSLINLITSELKDIESVYIITHHADISIPYDDKIRIVKNEEGISNIESNI